MPNAAHLHILLVHIPVILLPAAMLIWLIGEFRANRSVIMTGAGVIALCGILVWPPYLTGEGAEEMMEDRPGISEDRIEDHEESAEFVVWMVSATGLTALIYLIALTKRPALKKPLAAILLILSLLSSAGLAFTANKGGTITHPEINEKVDAPTG